MWQKIKIIIFLAVGLMLLAGGAILLSKKIISAGVDIQSKQMFEKMRQEIERLKKEEKDVSQENEKLKADAVSYLSINARIQSKQEEFVKRFNEVQMIIDTKEADIQRFKRRVAELEKKLKEEESRQESIKIQFFKEKEELTKQINMIEAEQKREKALYHYNLGVAFTKAKLYVEAQNALEESLKFNPDNPEAHYNLGLLFENYRKDPLRATLHYRKYLRLKPQAEDKEEVEMWIKKILNQTTSLNY